MNEMEVNRSPREVLDQCRLDNRELKKTIGDFRKVIHKCRKDSIASVFPPVFSELKHLEAHYTLQQNVLFPLISDSSLQPPLPEIKEKQERIRTSLKEVRSSYERGHTDELCACAAELMEEIRELNLLEDRVIFPSVENALLPK